MPHSARRRRLTPEQRRIELLEAGERVVRRMGVGARVEDVVLAANASKGTFYVYFETWEAFLLALRDRAFEVLQARFETFCRGCTNWQELIGGLPALFIDLTLSLEGLHAAAFHGPVAQVPVKNRRFDVRFRLGELIQHGMVAGALHAPDIPMTTQYVFALLHEAADLVESGQDQDKAASTLRALLLTALRVEPVGLEASDLEG